MITLLRLLILTVGFQSLTAQAGILDDLSRWLGLHRRTPIRVPVVVSRELSQRASRPNTEIPAAEKPAPRRVVVAKEATSTTTPLDLCVSPEYFWFSGNIYHSVLFPRDAQSPFEVPESLQRKLEMAKQDEVFTSQIKAFRNEMDVRAGTPVELPEIKTKSPVAEVAAPQITYEPQMETPTQEPSSPSHHDSAPPSTDTSWSDPGSSSGCSSSFD